MPKNRNTNLTNPVPEDIKEVASQLSDLEFWLCITFADTVKRYLEITMRQDDISPLHAIAMHYLVRAGGSLTPTHLAELMFRSKHSVTKIVDNLEKEGFIVRDFSCQDRRVTHIRITSAGLEYVRNNQNKGEMRAKQVMDCLDEPEQKKLAAITEKLSNRMTGILEKLG